MRAEIYKPGNPKDCQQTIRNQGRGLDRSFLPSRSSEGTCPADTLILNF